MNQVTHNSGYALLKLRWLAASIALLLCSVLCGTTQPSYIMMQSSSSSDEDYMEFDENSSSRKGGYLADRHGLKDCR